MQNLDVLGFSFKFSSRSLSLYKNNSIIGSKMLCDGPYKFKLDNVIIETLMALHHNIGTKHNLVYENSACGINIWVTYLMK